MASTELYGENRILRHTDGRIISFAQCAEDIVLWRAFSSFETGFYVDIGANLPSHDSVTKLFYDAGWSGINVEPVVTLYERLQSERPRDINLLAGVSDRSGQKVLHLNRSNLALSTFDPALADIYRARGADITRLDVPVVTLREVFEQHAPNKEIDFLKVDTENHEPEVIRGNDWAKFRPKIVLLECAPANASQVMELMSSVDYTFTLNDGINRWFVRTDCLELLGSAVSYPASPVPDWYHPSVYIETILGQRDQISSLEAELETLRSAGLRFYLRRKHGQCDGYARRVLSRARHAFRRDGGA